MKFPILFQLVGAILSPPSRGAWIEIPCVTPRRSGSRSPPSRGAWIEISGKAIGASIIGVAPLAGGVD